MYINTQTNEYPFNLSSLRSPYVSRPKIMTEEYLANIGVYLVEATLLPEVTNYQVAEETTPIQVDGVWTQQWTVRDKTTEELAEWRSTLKVSMRQARLALLGAGLLSSVDTAIAALEEPNKTLVSIEWEYAAVVDRTSPWMNDMRVALGITEEQLDDLFVVAATL